jgi:hypothetical protein
MKLLEIQNREAKRNRAKERASEELGRKEETKGRRRRKRDPTVEEQQSA